MKTFTIVHLAAQAIVTTLLFAASLMASGAEEPSTKSEIVTLAVIFLLVGVPALISLTLHKESL
jgi:hypothetical protein